MDHAAVKVRGVGKAKFGIWMRLATAWARAETGLPTFIVAYNDHYFAQPQMACALRARNAARRKAP